MELATKHTSIFYLIFCDEGWNHVAMFLAI